MRSSRKPVAIVAFLGFLAIPLGAWLVFGAHDHEGTPAQAPVGEKQLPAFWEEAAAPDDSAGAMLTHGGWFCANPDCRFLKMSGGQAFRSAKSQACSLCRQPLVQTRPVASLPSGGSGGGGVTAPEGG